MPGATLLERWSISSAPVFVFDEVTADFFAGVTVKSLLSGAIILIERATLSLFLKIKSQLQFLKGL